MKLPAWKKLAALALLAASPLMIASDEMETPCIDEPTGLPCWDIVPQSVFYTTPGWSDGPALGQCFTCIQSRWAFVPGSTFTGYVATTPSTLTCTVGVVVGAGGNRWCYTTATSPTTLITVLNYAGTRLCNGGNGCAWN